MIMILKNGREASNLLKNRTSSYFYPYNHTANTFGMKMFATVVCKTVKQIYLIGMKKKVVTVTIDGRDYAVSYSKKVKNLMVEYTVQVHDSLLRQKGVENYYRFQLYSKRIIFPDGTKSTIEKNIKQKIAECIVDADAGF